MCQNSWHLMMLSNLSVNQNARISGHKCKPLRSVDIWWHMFRVRFAFCFVRFNSFLSVPWWLLPSKDWTWVTPSAFLSIVLHFPWKLTVEDHRPSWYFAYRYGPCKIAASVKEVIPFFSDCIKIYLFTRAKFPRYHVYWIGSVLQVFSYPANSNPFCRLASGRK